jgi:AraC family transcriptional regulator
MELNLSTLGGIEMKVTIIEKPEMKLLGYAVRTSSVDGRNMQEIPAFWQHYLREGLQNNIPYELKLNPNAELGVCVDFDQESGDFSYLIGFEVGEETELENKELVYHTIPAATYAVFTTEPTKSETFSDVIQGTWQKIFQEWFPTSGYQHAGTPEFEWYDDRSSDPKHMVMDIYIPIVKQSVTTS